MPRHGSAEPGADVESVPDAPRRSSIAGWSIRRKLTLLVTIPLVVLLIGGGFLVWSLTTTYQKAHTARLDAELMEPSLRLSRVLFNEFGMPGANTDAEKLAGLRAQTDSEVAAIRPKLEDLADRGSSDSALPGTATTMLAQLDRIPSIRSTVDSMIDNGALSGSTGVNQVRSITELLFDVTRDLPENLATDLGVTTNDIDTVAGGQLFSAVSRTGFSAAEEITVFSGVFTGQTKVNITTVRNLESLVAQQALGVTQAEAVADDAQTRRLLELSNLNANMNRWRNSLENSLVEPGDSLGSPNDFTKLAVSRLADIETVATEAGRTTLKTAQDAETGALFRVAVVAGAVLVTILVVSALLTTIARTVTAPLRRLRAGAVEVASVQLPAAVARIEQDGVGADISLPPVLPADFNPGPETLEVAHAVDDLGAEAVRLATAQVRLRRALDEAFVSMSRRSQSMVEKQLAIIDSLESQEQDPDQLRNLFRLDHLAARMRRYNDNLLVLAGSAVRTRATAPVKIAELFRAATSEMEQYERVRLQPVSGASIAGTVAGELVHLLAELLDNAAMYSPPSSAIVLSAAFTADGGLQIEVLDAGVGISPGELDRLNARLTQPESIDTQVPSRMGLFVVARLARRGTFGVQLQARPDASGTIALVRVPASLVIGAPGSTGENPTGTNPQVRPLTPSAGMPRPQLSQPQGQAQNGYGTFGQMGQPALREQQIPAPSPAATAAGAAAQAAAGVRSVADEDDSELPRRRRGPATGTNAGLPPEASNIADTGSSGLFTPNIPTAPGEAPERNAGTFAARPGAAPQQQPAAFSFSQDDQQQGFARPESQPARTPQFTLPPPETTPGGIPSLPTRTPGARTPQPLGGLSQGFGQNEQGFGPEDEQPEQGFNTRAGLGFGQQNPPNFTAQQVRGLGQPDPTFGQPLPGFGQAAFENNQRQPPARPAGYGADDNTPAAGISGLPGLSRRPIESGPATGGLPVNDPLSASTGSFRAAPNRGLPSGQENSDWQDPDLPTELAARASASAAYRPAEPPSPMIGENVRPDFNDPTPIFDQISVWFSSEPAPAAPSISVENGDQRVIDLRDHERENTKQSSRWAALGDQRWLATNARAASAPETDGRSDAGLPTRRPGANLLPSTAGAVTDAAAARPRATPARGQAADATVVRGRLGSYQRGLANARKARQKSDPAPAFNPVGASLFTTNSDGGADSGSSAEQGGDQ
ncbi:histidine kinase [Kineosporia sp. NBRC 101677]|uniref:sensor histidine kinase n=1 Tax=Kineosporia sp. NBRC 101677 TaxID=3032197 RepID=UPI0024A5F3FD|nr:nitrate- and nitrite sensing domain-containing protein [Kineosporia sp. NBRC 101677]GLY14174.1 histidine kinase [Kineosporia sp. NBRC 101677]